MVMVVVTMTVIATVVVVVIAMVLLSPALVVVASSANVASLASCPRQWQAPRGTSRGGCRVGQAELCACSARPAGLHYYRKGLLLVAAPHEPRLRL